MNNRFKFRTFKNGEMVYFDVFSAQDKLEEDTRGEMSSVASQMTDAVWEIDPSLPIMQSTGLKDKNGKLIYEGDIVKYDRPKEAGWDFLCTNTVIWDEDGFRLNKFSAAGYFWHEMEIIGNIYEN